MMFEQFEDAGQKALWWCERANLALFWLFAALSEIAVLVGLIYQAADLTTGGLLTHTFPLIAVIWIWVQAAAVCTHLAILPVQAMEHRRAGNPGRFTLAVLVVILLVASVLYSLTGADWPFLRSAALVGIVLVGRVLRSEQTGNVKY